MHLWRCSHPSCARTSRGESCARWRARFAEQLYLWDVRFTGCVRLDDGDRTAAADAVRKSAVTAEQRKLLASGDDDETKSRGDFDQARDFAKLLVAEDEVLAYLAWLEVSARRIVYSDEYVRLLKALVLPLLQHEQLSGEAVTAVLNQARRDRCIVAPTES